MLQETGKTKHPQLLYEAKLYNILQGGSMFLSFSFHYFHCCGHNLRLNVEFVRSLRNEICQFGSSNISIVSKNTIFRDILISVKDNFVRYLTF